MKERKMLAVLAVILAVKCATGMFFHEPSNVVIQFKEIKNGSDFGFAMTYRNETKTLVVSAPKADFIGKIFNCEMDNADVNQKIFCGEQDIDINPAEYNTEKFPDQHFHMGSTIVATNDYFFWFYSAFALLYSGPHVSGNTLTLSWPGVVQSFNRRGQLTDSVTTDVRPTTCAPLWPTNIIATNKTGYRVKEADTFGTCFVHNEHDDTIRYKGLLEYYLKSSAKKKGFKSIRTALNVDRFRGGTGWSTLIDEDNGLLLIAKTSLSGDFFYLPVSDPYTDVRSLADQKTYQHYLPRFWNIGFGLTAGKFFSDQTVYAFSMLQDDMEGIISFLVYGRKNHWLSMLARNRAEATNYKFIQLHSNAVGTMFGTTMSAADLNLDGLDELLVGAPAQSEDECFECGALHIYISGDMTTINEPKRLRSIFGSAYFGRFGTAIAAKDIDGDGKPELVVSAPYENHGVGAVYILSGYEVYNTLMKAQDFKSIQLSDLKLTQRIQKESYRTLGFSLQFIEDVDENGCHELAASSTGSSKVLLFKCVQKINVTLSSQLIGEQIVREQDTFFTVQVCARVQLPQLPADIIGNITIESSIIGEAAIVQQPNIVIDISCFNCHRNRKNLCENVTVELADKEPGDYTFKSKAQIQNNLLSDKYMEEFNNSWVEASPYSKLDTSLEVSRHCRGNDCIPKLSMTLLWSGSNTYLLGSTANETVTIKVRNVGNASYSACVWLRVIGAPLFRVDCESYKGGYRCYLPKPLRRDTEHSINLMLNMTKPTNVAESLLVKAFLYENCYQEINYSSEILTIPFNLTSEGVFSEGDTHKLNITDKQILEHATIYDHHEYQIRNNGSITWKQVKFTVEMLKKPYINSFNIAATDFGKCNSNNLKNSSFIIHHCTLDLLPNTTLTIIGNTEIFARQLKGYLNGGELSINSTSQLFLSDQVPMLSAKSSTAITFQKEIKLANKKWLIILIAVIVALILLAILTFVLYKCGFFRRQQKQKLLVLQESIRRKSIRRNTHASAMDGPMEGLQMDVDDDCPFDEARPVTTKDNVGLVFDHEP